MKIVFHFTARAYFRTKNRVHRTDIFDNIAADDNKKAQEEFLDVWSAPNVTLTDIRHTMPGVAYTVGKQPKDYKFMGYRFRDNDIREVRIYGENGSFSFITESKTCDLSIGLNWTKEEFQALEKNLIQELNLT